MSEFLYPPEPAGRPPAGPWRSIGRRLVRFLRPYAAAVTRFLGLAWPGAAVGLMLAALLLFAYAGFCMGSGLGTFIDVAGSVVAGTIILTLAALLIMLLLALARRMPLRFLAVALTAFGCLLALGSAFNFSSDFALRLGAPPVLLLALTGAGLSVLRRRGHGWAGAVHAVLGSLMLLAAAAGGAAFTYWVARPGQDPFLDDNRPVVSAQVTPLDLPDPSQAGGYEVATLFYGSGTDKRRPEYARGVDMQTDPVDASPFVGYPKGYKGWARRKYWGFEPNSLPLNARVWYPKGEGPFPLVLIVHGNHKMEEFSDPGYGYLGELLASRGFILASIDENFLNVSWSGDLGGENDARGWLLLKHLERWRAWNTEEGSPFQSKVDLANIALIGHSRGGEAIAHAAAFNQLKHYPDDAKIAFDFGFAIRTLIAIAPIDGQYEPMGRPVPIENVNYLVLQGSHDSDLDFFAGARSYRRVRFADGNYWMKAALYIHRANHGQFNTVWGRYDTGPPLKHFLARGALLSGADQRRIAGVYISAFLAATLRGRNEYAPMFRDHQYARHWLPETVYLSRFEDSSFQVVSNFDESIDVTQTTAAGGRQEANELGVWRHREMEGRGSWPFHDYAVVLGWDRGHAQDSAAAAPSYTITLPDDLAGRWQLDARTLLSFCLADTDEKCETSESNEPEPAAESQSPGDANDPNAGVNSGDPAREPIDLTVALVAADGTTAELPLSRIRPLQPVLKVTFTKWSYWERLGYKSPSEAVLQTYEIPLSYFVETNSSFNPSILQQIRFRFDRTKNAVIILDQVGFARPPDFLEAPRQAGAPLLRE